MPKGLARDPQAVLDQAIIDFEIRCGKVALRIKRAQDTLARADDLVRDSAHRKRVCADERNDQLRRRRLIVPVARSRR